ncbi:hypothetical protein D9M73_172920 [compost metagenome]
MRQQRLLDQAAELLGVPGRTDLQAIVDQFDAVLFLDQPVGDLVGLQYLAGLIEDDRADRHLVHRAGVQIAFGFDAVELHVDLDRTFQVRNEMREHGLFFVAERLVVTPAADANAALGAVDGVDVGTEDVEHVHRFKEVLVELGILPVVVGDELGEGHHLAVGQVDKRI